MRRTTAPLLMPRMWITNKLRQSGAYLEASGFGATSPGDRHHTPAIADNPRRSICSSVCANTHMRDGSSCSTRCCSTLHRQAREPAQRRAQWRKSQVSAPTLFSWVFLMLGGLQYLGQSSSQDRFGNYSAREPVVGLLCAAPGEGAGEGAVEVGREAEVEVGRGALDGGAEVVVGGADFGRWGLVAIELNHRWCVRRGRCLFARTATPPPTRIALRQIDWWRPGHGNWTAWPIEALRGLPQR
jgi:hypothetical protein